MPTVVFSVGLSLVALAGLWFLEWQDRKTYDAFGREAESLPGVHVGKSQQKNLDRE